MLDVGVKIDGAVGATGQVDDDDFNAGTQELKNAVTRSGQTLSGANDEQVGEAMSISAGAASSCIDSGTPNTVVLTPTTGANGLKLPTTYALFNGWEVFFYIKETNTGNVTINIGQTVGIGAKKLLQKSGDEIPSGSLPSDSQVRARYDPLADGGTGAWVLDSSVIDRPYLKFSEVLATGTDGGGTTAGSTAVRALNTEDTDTADIGSLSANQITLPAGRYSADISAPALEVAGHQAYLYDVTGAAILILGTSEFSGVAVTTHSRIRDDFTLGVASVLEIRHFVTLTKANNGFGATAGSGLADIYTVAEFWRYRK